MQHSSVQACVVRLRAYHARVQLHVCTTWLATRIQIFFTFSAHYMYVCMLIRGNLCSGQSQVLQPDTCTC